MKHLTILKFIVICALGYNMAKVPIHNSSIYLVKPPAVNTLAQGLDEIAHIIPLVPIQRLGMRYLLNDEQFQAFVRIMNSNDAYTTQMRFRSQPEVIDFINWLQNQIMLSGCEFQLEESEEFSSILNRSPFDSNTVFGWPGIVNGFLLYYPEDMIRSHVQAKVAQNGIFAQFLQRLQALAPVYDRITALPEVQRLAAALVAAGIDINALDTFIRNQFGWQTPRTVASTAPK